MENKVQVFVNPSPTPSVKPKSNLFIKIILYITVLIILLLILFGSILVSASYADWQPPLIPKNLMSKVDWTIASAPLLPKTSKQILTKAILDSNKINTAYQKIHFKASSTGKSTIEQIEFILDFEGPFDATDIKNIKLASTLKGSFGLGAQTFDFDVKIIQIGSDFYLRLDKISNLLSAYGYNFSKATGKWFKINLEDVQRDFDVQAKEDEEVQKDSEELLSKLIDKMENRDLFKKFNKLQDEKIGEEDSYHLSLILTSEDLEALILDVYKEVSLSEDTLDYSQDLEQTVREIAKYFKNTKVELWITQKDFIVNKFNFTTDYVIPASSRTSLLFNETLATKFEVVYSIEQINEPQVIEPPSSYTDIDSLLRLLEEVYPESSKLNTTTDLPPNVLGTSTINIPKNILIIPDLIKSMYFLAPAANL